jgi:hypothetical protein
MMELESMAVWLLRYVADRRAQSSRTVSPGAATYARLRKRVEGRR